MLDQVELWVGLVGGAVTLGGLAWGWLKRWQFLLARRRWLGLSGLTRNAPVDVVLTTSEVSESSVGVSARRPMTGVGQVKGLANVARCMGYYLNKSPFRTFLSASLASEIDDHIILLGGPAKNPLTRRLLEPGFFIARDEFSDLVLDDLRGIVRTRSCGTFENLTIDQDGLPLQDVAIVLIGPSPFAAGSRRRTVISCFGLTTYGTEAATRLMFERLPELSRRQWRREIGTANWSGDDVTMLVAGVRVANGSVGQFDPVCIQTLRRESRAGRHAT